MKKIIFAAIFALFFSCSASAEEPLDGAELEKTRRAMVDYGIKYLRAAQTEEGGFSTRSGIGPTTVVLLGLLASGLPTDDPTVAAALDYLLRAVQPDGGIYSPGARIATYESCLALACLDRARKVSGSAEYDSRIDAAEKYLRGQQYNGETGVSSDDPYFGGLGYGQSTRPDLSNTQFFVETLRDLGAPADDPAIADALVFVSRCQNFESGGSSSVSAEAASSESTGESGGTVDDGGFIYTRVGEGESPAGEVDGGLRSYGSITYAGLKSLIYAGLTPDDPRVAAALGWIRKNYTMNENPGLGQRGLYYYYHTLSKTLDLLGGDVFTDADGNPHHWKAELIETLADAQRPDGSWANENRMWMETDPALVTGYALIVLSYCGEKKSD